ncbi:MAG: beta-mannosidase, partial [Bacteroidota bacterium]
VHLLENNLTILREIATEKNKLYAFTETGLERIEKPGWFNESLYPAIENSGIAWVLFWRNANKKHHYVPFKGHIAEEDFQLFSARPKTFLLNDLKTLKY